jgi:preprotein translocase subunit SecB
MADEKKPNFAIQRVFIKDLSFEGPNSPEIFQKEWAPELSVELNTSHRSLEKDFWEASIKITTTVKSGDDTAFVCEVEQCGIFTLSNFESEQVTQILETIAPEILFPFAREAISEAVSKGGFPQLLLAPINFEAYYQEKKKQQSR